MRTVHVTTRGNWDVILLFAVDCAIVREVVTNYFYGLALGVFATLPMGNILAIALIRGAPLRARMGAFLFGFELAGWLVVLALFFVFLCSDEDQLRQWNTWFATTLQSLPPLERVGASIDNRLLKTAYYVVANLAFLGLLTTLPQLTIACGGGWICWRVSANGTRQIRTDRVMDGPRRVD